jgi:hypothetical protein
VLDLDRLRIHVYDITLSGGRPPRIGEMAVAMESSEAAVSEALVELSSRRVLMLQPNGEILMAPPFSAVPTPFVVSSDTFTAHLNCAWDALGAAVMLQRPVSISASCSDCGEALRLESDGASVTGDSPLLHFALPPRRWWESIVFT